MSLEHLLLSWSPKKRFSVWAVPSAEEDDEVLIEGRVHREHEEDVREALQVALEELARGERVPRIHVPARGKTLFI